MSEWDRILWGFGPLALLGLIGFIYAWREAGRASRAAQEARKSGPPLDQH